MCKGLVSASQAVGGIAAAPWLTPAVLMWCPVNLKPCCCVLTALLFVYVLALCFNSIYAINTAYEGRRELRKENQHPFPFRMFGLGFHLLDLWTCLLQLLTSCGRGLRCMLLGYSTEGWGNLLQEEGPPYTTEPQQ